MDVAADIEQAVSGLDIALDDGVDEEKNSGDAKCEIQCGAEVAHNIFKMVSVGHGADIAPAL